MRESAPALADELHAGVLVDLTVPARANRLQVIRLTVDWASGEAGFGQTARENVVLAVDEACQNVIRHGYGGDSDALLRVRAELGGDALVVRVIDVAPAVESLPGVTRFAVDEPGSLDDVLAHLDAARRLEGVAGWRRE